MRVLIGLSREDWTIIEEGNRTECRLQIQYVKSMRQARLWTIPEAMAMIRSASAS